MARSPLVCSLFVSTARSLVREVLGREFPMPRLRQNSGFLAERSLAPSLAHNRQRKIDIGVLSKAVQSVVDMHAVSLLHRQVWDRYVAASSSSSEGPHDAHPPLFQHAHARRVRWTRAHASAGIRHLGAYVWTPLVSPLVREIYRRAQEFLNESATPEEVSSLSDERVNRPGGEAGHSFSRELQHAQMNFLMRQVRALVPVAVEAHLTGLEDVPMMAMLSLIRGTGVVDNIELFTELVEQGDLPRDSQTAKLAHGCVRAFCPPRYSDSVSCLLTLGCRSYLVRPSCSRLVVGAMLRTKSTR